MFLKRVTVTGSIKSLSCYPSTTAGYSTFSRDHRWLIYQLRGFEYDSSTIRIVRTDGSDDRLLVDFANGVISAFALSPDEQTVAFTTAPFPLPRGGESGTWVISINGTGLRKISTEAITPSSDRDELGWSPNSNRIVFRRLLPDSELITIRVTDGATNQIGVGFRPRWAPNGRWIAFQRGKEIRVVAASGGASHRVASGWIGDWSPDSRAIAFFRNREDPTLWVVPAGGGKAQAVSRRASGWFDRAWGDLPAWSPRGKRIASVAYDQFRERTVLLLASVSGNTRLRPRPIARHPSYRTIEALSWARDGRSIFYLSDTAD